MSSVLDVFQVDTTLGSALEPWLLGGDVDGVGEVHEGLGTTLVECLVPEQIFSINIFAKKLQEPFCCCGVQLPPPVAGVASQIHSVDSLETKQWNMKGSAINVCLCLTLIRSSWAEL